jgi:L-alanine-DL-glutamate epimerase-like enolase superfamily enzyme
MPVATDPKAESRVEGVEVSAFRVPTDEPESDGTLEWDSTTIVTVLVAADGELGLGYTYSDASVAELIRSTLAPIVEDADPRSPPAVWAEMHSALRNVGQAGPGAMALSAVDVAVWDLKARLLGVPLADALPRFHERVPI